MKNLLPAVADFMKEFEPLFRRKDEIRNVRDYRYFCNIYDIDIVLSKKFENYFFETTEVSRDSKAIKDEIEENDREMGRLEDEMDDLHSENSRLKEELKEMKPEFGDQTNLVYALATM